mmetsp:Transcript_34219/g.102188  ORF Transcript_34219/g.102188 Transcript_34219/m.102188 type:complete len:335 (+) Transcript_34219:53-1057(+)
MGAAGTTSCRTVLENDAQVYFTTLQLHHDVPEIVKGWFEDGASLGLTSESFQQLLRLDGTSNVDSQALFQLFDTDSNHKVDVLEVLSAAIVLTKGTVAEKLDAAFPVFSFSSTGSLGFDELNILLHSVCRGLTKVCQMPQVKDEDLIAACRHMFDSHNLTYDKPITPDQVKRWMRSDVEAASFARALDAIATVPMLEAELARREDVQAKVFSQLCRAGYAVRADSLGQSDALRQALGDTTREALEGLFRVMGGSEGTVTVAEFSCAARAWNAFTAIDIAMTGQLDASKLPLLLQLREHEVPPKGEAERLREAIAKDGRVSRDRWIAASLEHANT